MAYYVVAYHFQQIKKSNVDHFSSGQMIPKCELLLRWPHREIPHVCLEHDIELTGAKGCSYFTLYVPDEGEKYSYPMYSCMHECFHSVQHIHVLISQDSVVLQSSFNLAT